MATKLMKRTTTIEEYADMPDGLSGTDDLGNAENEDVEVDVDDETTATEPETDDDKESDEEQELDKKCAARATKKRGGVW